MFRSVLVVGMFLFVVSASTTVDKPNLLLLFPDQWRYDWAGFNTASHGNPIPLNLPTVASVAARGTRFSHGIVGAPVCAPSRSVLATGRQYDNAGVACNFCNDLPVGPGAPPTFYKLLRDNGGYHTMTTGKDDLTKATQPGLNGTLNQVALGFSDGIRYSGKMDVVDKYPAYHEMYGWWLANQTVALEDGTPISAWKAHTACIAPSKVKDSKKDCDRTDYTDELYEDNWTAENALTLLKRKPANKPWFMQVSFPGPHSPFLVTANMSNTVSNRTWPPPIDTDKKETCPQKHAAPNEPASGGRCNYAAEVENLDRLFNKILAYVENIGEMDKTVVCIASDHGEMLGNHGDSGKTMPWSGSLEVPLMCAGPGIEKGKVIDDAAATMDLAATFLDFAGVDPDPGMNSTSLRPVLEGKTTTVRPFIPSGLQSSNFGEDIDLGAGGYQWRLAIKRNSTGSQLKMICCHGKCNGAPSTAPGPASDGYTRLLYDIEADPFDMHNLAPLMPETVEEMRQLLPSGKNFNCPPMPKHDTSSLT